MELLEFLKQIPLPILILVVAILLIVTIVIAVQYMKAKGLDGIREDVYQLILKAEHMYNESGTGKQKLQWVIQQARGCFRSGYRFLYRKKPWRNLYRNGLRE